MKYPELIVFTLAALLLGGCKQDTRGVALGSLERDRISLTAPASEQISLVAVHEGQTVKAGDLLIQLDTTSAKARLQQRLAEQQQARAALAELSAGARSETIAAARARVSGAQASLTDTSQQLQRAESLFKSRMVGQADLDSARARKDAATASLNQYEDQLQELINGTRPEQITQAEAALNATSARLALEQKALDDLSIRAPVDATLDILPWHTGDRVSAGTLMVSLLANSAAYARVYLPHEKLAQLHPGSQVQVSIDGVEQVLTGTIRNIRSQSAFTPYFALNERDRARLMHLTDIDLPEQAGQLPTGLSVAVKLP